MESEISPKHDEFGGEPQGSGTACEGDLDGNGIDEACELDDVCEDCDPGDHWVDQCAAGSDDMSSGALVGIDLDLDCQADVSMVLSGAVKIVENSVRHSCPSASQRSAKVAIQVSSSR